MKFTRRRALRMIGAAIPAIAVSRSIALSAPEGVAMTEGRYAGTRDSLKAYTIPD